MSEGDDTTGRSGEVSVTGRLIPEHPLDELLRGYGPEAPNSERLLAFWQYYEEQTGITVRSPPSQNDRKAALEWLRSLPGDSWPLFMHKVPRLRSRLHRTVTEKASALVQLACPACETGETSQGLKFCFSVGLTPWTAQSRRNRVAIRRAVNASLRAKPHKPPYWATSDLCVSIVALVPARRPQQDVDNLAKGLLDALEGYVYKNDRQVQCLTVRRLPYSGTQGCYFICVSPAAPAASDVIYDAPERPNLSWGYIED